MFLYGDHTFLKLASSFKMWTPQNVFSSCPSWPSGGHKNKHPHQDTLKCILWMVMFCEDKWYIVKWVMSCVGLMRPPLLQSSHSFKNLTVRKMNIPLCCVPRGSWLTTSLSGRIKQFKRHTVALRTFTTYIYTIVKLNLYTNSILHWLCNFTVAILYFFLNIVKTQLMNSIYVKDVVPLFSFWYINSFHTSA